MPDKQLEALEQASKLPSWFIVVPIAFLIGGIVAMWLARRYWKLAQASKSWPSATGTVISNTIRTSESSNNDNTSSITRYSPEIEYEFVVNGQTHRGNRIKFGGVGQSTSLSKAQAIAARYPLHGDVQVFYDPAKPTQCTLDQEISFFGVMLLFMFGAIFALVSLGGFGMLALMHGGN